MAAVGCIVDDIGRSLGGSSLLLEIYYDIGRHVDRFAGEEERLVLPLADGVTSCFVEGKRSAQKLDVLHVSLGINVYE